MSLESSLRANSYPGRGIIVGESANGKYAVCAYFIMGRSTNSRNRIFIETPGVYIICGKKLLIK